MRMLTMCESVHTARGVFGSWCRAGSMAGCLASSMDVQGARSVVRAAALFYPRALGAQALGGARRPRPWATPRGASSMGFM